MHMCKSTSETWANVSTVLTAAIAFAALGVAIHQINVSREIQREASARDAYKEYLKLGMENPELADARNGKWTKTENGRSKYAWFVSYFLFSAEQIYVQFPKDAEWNKTLSDQICYHKTYLNGSEYQQTLKNHYARTFSDFVDNALKLCAN